MPSLKHVDVRADATKQKRWLVKKPVPFHKQPNFDDENVTEHTAVEHSTVRGIVIPSESGKRFVQIYSIERTDLPDLTIEAVEGGRYLPEQTADGEVVLKQLLDFSSNKASFNWRDAYFVNNLGSLLWDYDTTVTPHDSDTNWCYKTWLSPQFENHPAFPIFTTSEETLGFKIGVGIQLFLATQRSYAGLMLLMFILSLYALFADLSGDQLKFTCDDDNLDDCETFLTKSTLGNIQGESLVIGHVLFEVLIVLSALGFLVYLRAKNHFRYQLFKDANPTAADFAVLLENLPEDASEEKVRQFLKDKVFQNEEFQYRLRDGAPASGWTDERKEEQSHVISVLVPTDTRDLIVSFAEFTSLSMQKESELARLAMLDSGSADEKPPIRWWPSFWCKHEKQALTKVLKERDSEIAEVAKALQNAQRDKERLNRCTGYAIVVFDEQKTAQKLVDWFYRSNGPISFNGPVYQYILNKQRRKLDEAYAGIEDSKPPAKFPTENTEADGCCASLFKRIQVSRAPQPGEIFWENFGGKSRRQRTLMTWLTGAITLAVVGVAAAILVWIEEYKQDERDDPNSSDEYLRNLSIATSIATSLLNLGLKQVIKLLTGKLEQQYCLTNETISFMPKLSMAYLMNSVLLYLLIIDKDNWYVPGGLADTAFYLALSDMFTSNAIQVLNAKRIFKGLWYSRKAYCQPALDDAFKIPDFEIAAEYADLVKTLGIAFAFGPMCPPIYAICVANILLTYIVAKYLLLRTRSPPDGLQQGVEDIFRYFVNMLIFVHIIIAAIFFGDAGQSELSYPLMGVELLVFFITRFYPVSDLVIEWLEESSKHIEDPDCFKPFKYNKLKYETPSFHGAGSWTYQEPHIVQAAGLAEQPGVTPAEAEAVQEANASSTESDGSDRPMGLNFLPTGADFPPKPQTNPFGDTFGEYSNIHHNHRRRFCPPPVAPEAPAQPAANEAPSTEMLERAAVAAEATSAQL